MTNVDPLAGENAASSHILRHSVVVIFPYSHILSIGIPFTRFRLSGVVVAMKLDLIEKVHQTELPIQSELLDRIAPTDFIDCYWVKSTLETRKAAEIIAKFPGWARALVHLRNIITLPFGLLTDGPPSEDKVGLFPVESENDHELIAGFNDKHLNFRVSVMSGDGRVYLATWVHPHNIGGRIYLKTILPFHVLISRNALARVAQS